MRITIFLFDGITALDAVGVYDPLARLPNREIVFASATGRPVATGDGTLKLGCDIALFDIDETDVLLVPGGNRHGLSACTSDTALLAHFRALDAKTAITGSICSGAVILGAAGLLGGRRVATIWRVGEAVAHFGASYSGERVTIDGKYWTAAGVTAAIDLGLQLCEHIAGREIAAAIELGMEYAPSPPFGTGDRASATPERLRIVNEVLSG